MYSEESLKYLRSQKRRLTFRRIRQGTLFVVLLGVATWGLITHFADNRTFAWDRPVSIAVISLYDDMGSERDVDLRYIQRFLSRSAVPDRNLKQVEQWIHSEYARHTGERGPIL